MKISLRLSLLWLLFTFAHQLLGIRIASTKIYQTVDSGHYCVRRLNATHTIGCQSKASGNVGILHIVRNSTNDLDWVLREGTTPPYVVALYLNDFTLENLKRVNDSDRVAGVMLLRTFQVTEQISFSPDGVIPNERYGLYVGNGSNVQRTRHIWNYDGQNRVSGMMFLSWRFPIFLINNNDTNQMVIDCFSKFNNPNERQRVEWPLCAVQLRSRMNAAKNAVTCLRRNSLGLKLDERKDHCVPLKSVNLLTPLYPVNSNSTIAPRSVIILATRLDGFALFESAAFSVRSAITSVVTMLSIVDTLTKSGGPRMGNVLFTFFNGESWGYIGSSKLATELTNSSVSFMLNSEHGYRPPKLNMSQIRLFVELDQISSIGKLFVHTENTLSVQPEVEANVTTFVNLLKTALPNFDLRNASAGQGLPPSSLQSFLAENPTIPGVVLSSYNSTFSNLQYHSFLDDREKLSERDIDYITNVSTLVSRAVIATLRAQNSQTQNISADSEKVKEIFYCFFGQTENKTNVKHNCSLLKNRETDYSSQPFDTQIGDEGILTLRGTRTYSSYPYLAHVYRILLSLTGTVAETTEHACEQAAKKDTNYVYTWDTDLDVCTRSSCLTSRAESPAFRGDTLDGKSKYSTWVESINGPTVARIFLKPNLQQELIMVLSGVLLTAFGTAFLYVFSQKARTLLSELAD